MAYRAFVSSTYEDLKSHRTEVITVLRKAGFIVDPMEDWSSADDEPRTFSSKRLEGCDLGVLVVALRRGYIPEGSGRSITQQEYGFAIQHAIDMFVFVLDENSPWARRYDELDRDPGVRAWRTELIEKHIVGFFNTDPRSIDIAPALTRWMLARAERERPEKVQPETRDKLLFKNFQVVRVLLSSPGDVEEEREAYARSVFRFNQDFVEDTGVFVKLVRWEDMAPQIGPGPQQVVNLQTGDYDILSLIMWNRFGTPTDLALSGTEEEFNEAIASYKKRDYPWIVTYFCSRESNLRTIEQIEQKARVIRFREQVETLGIVKEYDSVELFERRAYEDLRKITTRPDFLQHLGKKRGESK